MREKPTGLGQKNLISSSSTRICPICGKSKRKERITCSRKCSDVIRSQEPARKWPTLVCVRCKSEFSVSHARAKVQKYCSRDCAQKRGTPVYPKEGVVSTPREKAPIVSGGYKRLPCVVCSKRTRVVKSYANSRVLCKKHKKVRSFWLDKIKSLKDTVIGETAFSPYSFYVVRAIDTRPMVWVISLYHSGTKEILEVPLVQYLSEVKYNRFMREDEKVRFLDGNSQNLEVSNLSLVSTKELKLVHFKSRHNSAWVGRGSTF